MLVGAVQDETVFIGSSHTLSLRLCRMHRSPRSHSVRHTNTHPTRISPWRCPTLQHIYVGRSDPLGTGPSDTQSQTQHSSPFGDAPHFKHIYVGHMDPLGAVSSDNQSHIQHTSTFRAANRCMRINTYFSGTDPLGADPELG